MPPQRLNLDTCSTPGAKPQPISVASRAIGTLKFIFGFVAPCELLAPVANQEARRCTDLLLPLPRSNASRQWQPKQVTGVTHCHSDPRSRTYQSTLLLPVSAQHPLTMTGETKARVPRKRALPLVSCRPHCNGTLALHKQATRGFSREKNEAQRQRWLSCMVSRILIHQ